MASGDLDTSFDRNGKKAVNFGGSDQAFAVLVQPDGRIVVVGGGAAAGSFCVARLRSNGALDTSFDGNGKQTVDLAGRTSARSARRSSPTARSSWSATLTSTPWSLG